MIFGKPSLRKSVDAFAAAVAAHDSKRSQAALQAVERAMRSSRAGAGPGREEWTEAGPRLAALMDQVPPGPRSVLAVMVGACVEGGADPAACAGPVLSGALAALEDAARLSGTRQPAEFHASAEGQSLEQWEMAAVAMLSHQAVRQACGQRAGMLAAAEQLGGALRMRCLVYSLLVLDEEPLIALHRPSGSGFALRMRGIGDNFQLHTLLGGVLIGGGHLPGEAPSAEAVALCRDRNVAPQDRPDTVGSFNLVAPDGTWIWNEGTPSDIPLVAGARLLVLDTPPYRRGWQAGRFFPGMPADLALERVLEPSEAADWLARTSPATTQGR